MGLVVGSRRSILGRNIVTRLRLIAWVNLSVEEIVGGGGFGRGSHNLDTLGIDDSIIDNVFVLGP